MTGVERILTGQLKLVTLSLILQLLVLQCSQVQSLYDREKFKEIVTHDDTNDDAINMNAVSNHTSFSYTDSTYHKAIH